jgi:hypothetical protein
MSKAETETRPIGPILAANLYRLGYGEIVIRNADIARLIKQKTGREMSRQRIASILNSVRVEPSTIEMIANAIGVDPSELTKPIPKR